VLSNYPKKALANVQERFDLRLIANQDLLQAQQALQEAQLRLSSLEGRGLGRDGKIKATFSGIISKVDVQEGSLVTTGGPLLEISADNKLETRLGIEPEDMPLVKVGQTVSLGAGQPPGCYFIVCSDSAYQRERRSDNRISGCVCSFGGQRRNPAGGLPEGPD